MYVSINYVDINIYPIIIIIINDMIAQKGCFRNERVKNHDLVNPFMPKVHLAFLSVCYDDFGSIYARKHEFTKDMKFSCYLPIHAQRST